MTQNALLVDKPTLTKVLTHHVLPARVLEIPFDTPIATVQGSILHVSSSLQITDQRGRASNIAAADVFSSNGVVTSSTGCYCRADAIPTDWRTR